MLSRSDSIDSIISLVIMLIIIPISYKGLTKMLF